MGKKSITKKKASNKGKNKIDLIRAEYDKPGLGKHLVALRADEQRRTLKESRPDAVVIVPGSLTTSEDNYLLKPIKGSVMLFWGRQNSSLIPTLERAYATGDERVLRRLSDKFAAEFERRPAMPIAEGFKQLYASPMYFDLLYGSKQLISRLALSEGIDYGAVGFAYNGGVLNDSSFRLLEYHRPFERLRYETLIVKVPPELSPIEREALAAVPADQTDLNIGHATMCPAACVALVAIVVALVTCAGGCDPLRDQLARVSLTEDQLRQLGPLASARELLAVRREIFEQFGI